jgi:uncharacterized membrane protein HdeD (DUF308 family)
MDELTAFFTRVTAILPPAQAFVAALCFVLGIVLVIIGGRMLLITAEERSHAHHRRHGYWQAMTYIVFGLLIISLDMTLSAWIASLYGASNTTASAASEIMAYAPEMLSPVSGAPGEAILVALVRVAQFIGLLAVVRGLFLCVKSADMPAQGLMGKGFIHMIAGIMAVDLPRTVGLFENLFFG